MVSKKVSFIGACLLGTTAACGAPGEENHFIDGDPLTQSIDSENGMATINGMATVNGASTVNGIATVNGITSVNGAVSVNGVTSTNGMSTINGISTVNGMSTVNGIVSVNGLAPAGTLMTTAAGRTTISYMVKCTLAAGDYIDKPDGAGVITRFYGSLGVGTGWKNGACDTACQEWISACMMAHVNTTGIHVPIWLVADPAQQPQIGLSQSTTQTQREASFFGNLMTISPAVANYVYETNLSSTVAGRIGSGQTNVPYTNFRSSGGIGDMSECKTWKANPANTSHTDPVACGPNNEFTRVITSYIIPPPAVLNGDFENNLTNWTVSNVATSPWFHFNSATSAMLQVAGSTLSQTITGLTPNQKYVVSGNIYLDDYQGTGKGSMTLQASGFGGTTVATTITQGSAWLRPQVTFTTGASATSATISFIANSMPNHNMYVDQVSLFRGTPVSFPNGGFENGNTGWTGGVQRQFWGNTEGTSAGILLYLTDKAIATVTGLLPNTVYRMNATVKIDDSNGTGKGKVQLAMSSTGSTTKSTILSTYNVADIQNGTVVFVTGPSDTTATLTVSMVEKPNNWVSIDDIRIMTN